MKTFDLKLLRKTPGEPVGWFETELPKPVVERLQSYIKTARKNPVNHNHGLAGNITESLKMKDKDNWFHENVLVHVIGQFMKEFSAYSKKIQILSEPAPYCLSDFWVNFQKENEFNPTHNHAGIFSFVVFMKIPTDWKEQHALPISVNSNSPSASNFQFHYTEMSGEITSIPYYLNKESEGGMLFFPSYLLHSVYPFYECNKERITISGNIGFDISENAMEKYRREFSQSQRRTQQKEEVEAIAKKRTEVAIDHLWNQEEQRTVLGLLKGRKNKKEQNMT